MRRLLLVIPIAMFFLNPNVACVDEPEFQYGAAEMRAAVEGDWSITISPDGGTATEVTVHIEQGTAASAATAQAPGRALVRAAHACGNRTLVKSAGACVDVSEMPLAVTYVSGDAAFSSATLRGNFAVHSLVFAIGELYLTLGSTQIHARVNADGTVASAELYSGGTVALNRL